MVSTSLMIMFQQFVYFIMMILIIIQTTFVSPLSIHSSNRNGLRLLNHEYDSVLSSNWYVKLTEREDRTPATTRAHSATIYALYQNGSSVPYQEYMIVSGGITRNKHKNVLFSVWAFNMTSATTSNQGRWYELTPPLKTSSSFDDGLCSHDIDDSLQDNVGIANRRKSCQPYARIEHISMVRDNVLYIFGGLIFHENENDVVYSMEQEPYMYRLILDESQFKFRDHENLEESFGNDAFTQNYTDWERWIPHFQTNEYNPESTLQDMKTAVNRAEVRGGYCKSKDKLVIYGGIHVKEESYDEATTLGDVWAYDFQTDTWEMMAPSTSIDSDIFAHPGKRSAHGSTVVGDELFVHGGIREADQSPENESTGKVQLHDVWVFDLNSKIWNHRPMSPSIGRAYHSMVGWKDKNTDDTILSIHGGMKMIIHEFGHVYHDTIITSSSSVWLLAEYFSTTHIYLPLVMEHTTVLSEQFGNMFIFGGDVDGVWSLNIAGDTSTVEFLPKNDEDGCSGFFDCMDRRVIITLLAVSMFCIIMFLSCSCITVLKIRRKAIDESSSNADPSLAGSVESEKEVIEGAAEKGLGTDEEIQQKQEVIGNDTEEELGDEKETPIESDTEERLGDDEQKKEVETAIHVHVSSVKNFAKNLGWASS